MSDVQERTTHQMSQDDVYAHVGQRFRALRTEKRLTQADIAKVIHVSPQQYQKYEDAHTKCSLNNILMLAQFYNVSIDEILPLGTLPDAKTEEAEMSPLHGPKLEAALLSRLVSSYVKLTGLDAKLRLVQLVEAIVAQGRAGEHAE